MRHSKYAQFLVLCFLLFSCNSGDKEGNSGSHTPELEDSAAAVATNLNRLEVGAFITYPDDTSYYKGWEIINHYAFKRIEESWDSSYIIAQRKSDSLVIHRSGNGDQVRYRIKNAQTMKTYRMSYSEHLRKVSDEYGIGLSKQQVCGQTFEFTRNREEPCYALFKCVPESYHLVVLDYPEKKRVVIRHMNGILGYE